MRQRMSKVETRRTTTIRDGVVVQTETKARFFDCRARREIASFSSTSLQSAFILFYFPPKMQPENEVSRSGEPEAAHPSKKKSPCGILGPRRLFCSGLRDFFLSRKKRRDIRQEGGPTDESSHWMWVTFGGQRGVLSSTPPPPPHLQARLRFFSCRSRQPGCCRPGKLIRPLGSLFRKETPRCPNRSTFG